MASGGQSREPDDLEIDSPYNLYIHKGLGPAPICNPGQLSMTAVLNPADSPFLYFTARNDGSRSAPVCRDYDEQQANQDFVNNDADMSEYDSAYLKYLPQNENP